MRFEPPTIKQRGQVANAMAAAHAHKPDAGEYAGKMVCPRCRSPLNFKIASNGISRGQCAAACGVKWCQ